MYLQRITRLNSQVAKKKVRHVFPNYNYTDIYWLYSIFTHPSHLPRLSAFFFSNQKVTHFKWMFPKIVGFPPKSSILIGFPLFSPSILGVFPIFWKQPNWHYSPPKRISSWTVSTSPVATMLPEGAGDRWCHLSKKVRHENSPENEHGGPLKMMISP